MGGGERKESEEKISSHRLTTEMLTTCAG